MEIGNKIKELRIKSKITQEELAKSLQISTQAVSKWECGGSPDLELIPKIASYFNVTIDYLFDVFTLDYKDMEQKICSYISSISNAKERLYKIHELGYLMSIAAFGKCNVKDYDYLKIMSDPKDYVSLCNLDSGFAYTSFNKRLPFYLVFPRPINDEYNEAIISKEKQISFLKALASEDFYDVLIYINSRVNKSFTNELLMKEFKLTQDRTNEIIDILCNYSILDVNELELDDKVIRTYKLNDNPMIVALLAILNIIVGKYNCFYHYVNNKNGEYFKRSQK